MINAQELRLGNYIYEIVDTPENPEAKDIFIIAAVNAITKTVINTEDDITQLEYCEPIPLTPEILEACGFNNRKIKIDDFTTLEFKFNSFFVFLCQDNADIRCENVSISLEEVKYMHQLQNLFYVLTGKELEIKLPATVQTQTHMSIAANELRIGNWIFSETIGKNVQVTADLLYAIDTLKNGIEEEYSYIPLTYKILKACGFNNRKQAEEMVKEGCRLNICIDCVPYIETVTGVELEYLHQLQNLFYAITQTELQIKLPTTV